MQWHERRHFAILFLVLMRCLLWLSLRFQGNSALFRHEVTPGKPSWSAKQEEFKVVMLCCAPGIALVSHPCHFGWFHLLAMFWSVLTHKQEEGGRGSQPLKTQTIGKVRAAHGVIINCRISCFTIVTRPQQGNVESESKVPMNPFSEWIYFHGADFSEGMKSGKGRKASPFS